MKVAKHRDLYIFDLDGTLANCQHRIHLIAQEHPNWDQFHGECVRDEPIEPVLRILGALAEDADIWIVSGRSDVVRTQTTKWLARQGVFIEDHELMMRKIADYRPDDVIKQEYLDNMLLEDRQRLVCVFDDRDKVVAMWRKNGVPCMQVAPGNF